MDTSDTEMADQHRDCHPNEDPQDATNDDQASHPDCDWGFICACNIGQSQLGDEEWVPTHKDIEVVHTEGETLSPYSTPSQDIFADRQPRIGEHAPPLWLLYDTFLM